MAEKDIKTCEVSDLEGCIKVLEKFKDYEFLSMLHDENELVDYAKKVLENGHVIAEFLSGDPVGFVCFYCNDTESKTAFVTSFAIAEDIGFMKGKTFFRVISEGLKVCKETGMENILIEVDKRNKLAIRLYEHLGLEYMPEERETSFLMGAPIGVIMGKFYKR